MYRITYKPQTSLFTAWSLTLLLGIGGRPKVSGLNPKEQKNVSFATATQCPYDIHDGAVFTT
jgi:hypothetical protein